MDYNSAFLFCFWLVFIFATQFNVVISLSNRIWTAIYVRGKKCSTRKKMFKEKKNTHPPPAYIPEIFYMTPPPDNPGKNFWHPLKMNRFHFPSKNYTGILLSPPPPRRWFTINYCHPSLPSSPLSFCLHFNDIAWWIIWDSRKFRARYYFLFFVGQISLNYKKMLCLLIFSPQLTSIELWVC